MALLSRNYAITFHHGNQQMDFIRFEITPCMLKCNHFKPQNNFWSFSIVNWLVATSCIKRAASNTQKTQWIFYYLFDDATYMHVRTDSHVQQCFGFTIFGKVFFHLMASMKSPRWIRTISQKKARLHFCSISHCVDFYY